MSALGSFVAQAGSALGAAAQAGTSLQDLFSRVLSQDARLITLTSPLPEAALVVERFAGSESLSQCDRFEVDCLCGTAQLPLKRFIGEELSLRLRQADGSERAWHGMVSEAASLGADGGFVRYRLTLRPWLHWLSLRRTSRIFQDKSSETIVREVLEAYPGVQFRFDLHGELPVRPYVAQYRETDLDFVQRVLAAEGLSYRFEHEQDSSDADSDSAASGDASSQKELAHTRHALVIFDAKAELPSCPLNPIRYHRVSATEASDGIQAWHVAQSGGSSRFTFSQWAANALQAPAAETGLASGGLPQAKAWPELEHHAASLPFAFLCKQGAQASSEQEECQRQADFAAQSEALSQYQTRVESSVRALAPGQVFQLAAHPSVSADQLHRVVVVRHEAANNFGAGMQDLLPHGVGAGTVERGAYRNTAVVVPAELPCVPATQPKPFAVGMQTAVVVGTPDTAATHGLTSDRDLRVKIQFPWQRGSQVLPGGAEHDKERATGNEQNGIWVRVAEALAGPNWGAAFTPRVGTEVLVDFQGGDIDHPLIVAQLYNGEAQPPWPAGEGSGANHPGLLAGVHATTSDGSGWNQWLVDDSADQLRTRLATQHANSQLALGHLINQSPTGATRGGWRGQGFEMLTQGWAQGRAPKGLLITTSAQSQAASVQMDASGAAGQLKAAQDNLQRLAQAASQSKVPTPAHADAVEKLVGQIQPEAPPPDGKDAPDRELKGFAAPVLLVEAPAPVAMTTPRSATLYAGQHQLASVQRDAHIAAEYSASFVAGKALGLYSHQGGITAIAANGPVSLQAHDGPLEILADQTLELTSSADEIHLLAQQKIVLQAGQSQIELDGANITFKCPGAFTVKAASKSLAGGGSGHAVLADLPQGVLPKDVIELDHRYHDDEGVAGAEYELTLADGTVRFGKLDISGRAVERDVPMGPASVRFGPASGAYRKKDMTPNPQYNSHMTDQVMESIVDKHAATLVRKTTNE